VRALRAGGVRAPTVAAPDAVQLLTVHGAKGLEANTVLMLDCDAAAAARADHGRAGRVEGQRQRAHALRVPGEREGAAGVRGLCSRKNSARGIARNSTDSMSRPRGRASGWCCRRCGPARANEGSWWSRLEPLCEPTEAGEPLVDVPTDRQCGTAFAMKQMPPCRCPCPSCRAKNEKKAAKATVDARAAAFGQAMHRLLEWAVPGEALPAAHVRAAAREFMLDAQQARGAAALAQRIRAGEGAWVWDDRRVDWHGNEVTLVHEGETLRIDRLVRERDGGAWWILDYKSAARPERDAALIAQMQRYRAAVQHAYPGATVRVAFLTGQGELVNLE
jgi:ATP-dependent helicase/nuclease subunit A